MALTLGLAQCGFPADGDVLAQASRFVEEASAQGVEILAFPEDFMSPRPLTAPELHRIAQPLDGPLVRDMAELAQRHGLWLVFTMYEVDPTGGAPFNTAVVMDDEGQVRGTYHKCHLYDAHGVMESERTKPGDALFSPIETPFCKLGVAICYDLRFPEVARAAAREGCEVLLFPSAWYDGPQKAEHWETLLRARAIENELFVAGIGKAGERYVGRSLVANPLGQTVISSSGKEAELLVCHLDIEAIASARDAMPILGHRRPQLYASICTTIPQ